jgi:hypothetical protein
VYAADKKSAVYTDPTGATITIYPPLVYTVVYDATGSVKTTGDQAVNYTIHLYIYKENNAGALVILVEGAVNSTTKGTWTQDATTKAITFTPDGGTAIVLTYDADYMIVKGAYAINDTTTCNIQSAYAPIVTFAGSTLKLLCIPTNGKAGGKAVMTYNGASVGITGDWTFGSYKFTLTLSDVAQTVTMDSTSHAFSFEYTCSLSGHEIKDTYTCAAAEWGSKLL